MFKFPRASVKKFCPQQSAPVVLLDAPEIRIRESYVVFKVRPVFALFMMPVTFPLFPDAVVEQPVANANEV